MAKITVSWDESETERVMKAIEQAELLGETIADLKEIVQDLKQTIKSQVPQSDTTPSEN